MAPLKRPLGVFDATEHFELFLRQCMFDEFVKSKNHAIRWLSKNTDIQVSADSEE